MEINNIISSLHFSNIVIFQAGKSKKYQERVGFMGIINEARQGQDSGSIQDQALTQWIDRIT